MRPFRSGKFLAYSASNSDHGISSAIFTQRLRSDSFPHEGSSKSEGEGVASSAFLYTIAGGDARVLTYSTCLFCTLPSLSIAHNPGYVKRDRYIQQALIKQIGARIKIVGAQWNEKNVPQILRLRCAYLNNHIKLSISA